jgi:cytochrome o ubiquinol oxidase subunit II
MRVRTVLPLLASGLLAGCGGVLDPAGPVGAGDRFILLNALAIMLLIVVPTILATLAFAWWFRAGNARAERRPDWAFSGRLELVIWSVPALVIIFLGGIAWIGSHQLDPYKPLPGRAVEVQVVSLDWKWLFLYPQSGVATVNRLVIPAGAPVHFTLTSATVMNSFFVPRLGSQIYTMAGMTSQLWLQADRPGVYPGRSAHFSGDGFADMRFDAVALPPDRWAAWVAQARARGPVLDARAYAALARESHGDRPASFRATDPRLFDAIVALKAPAPQPAPGKGSQRAINPKAGS